MIVELSKSITVRNGEAGVGLKTSVEGLGPAPFKKVLDYSKKFVAGELLSGDVAPEQTEIDGVERLVIIGPFRTGNTSYDSKNETVSFRVNFAIGGKDIDEIRQMGGEKFWFNAKEMQAEPYDE